MKKLKFKLKFGNFLNNIERASYLSTVKPCNCFHMLKTYPIGLAAVLDDLGDLWEDEEYEREYDIRSFQESLRGEKTDDAS